MIRLRRGFCCVALGAGVLISGGCDKSPSLAPSEPPVVTVSKPLGRPITDFDQYTGRLEAAQTVEVRARVRGELLEDPHFVDGAMVDGFCASALLTPTVWAASSTFEVEPTRSTNPRSRPITA